MYIIYIPQHLKTKHTSNFHSKTLRLLEPNNTLQSLIVLKSFLDKTHNKQSTVSFTDIGNLFIALKYTLLLYGTSY